MKFNIPTKTNAEQLEKLIIGINNFISENYAEYGDQKLSCSFRNEVSLRGFKKPVKKAKLNFFISSNNRLCYTNKDNYRTGMYVNEYFRYSLESIEIFSINQRANNEEAERFLKKFSPDLWVNLQEKIRQDPKYVFNFDSQYKTFDIRRSFPNYVLEEIKDAIENKRDYRYREYGEKRTFTVEIETDKDGKLRAWYSSEYAGCANGDYYLLINPTTAAFHERD